jgi:predicted permease
MRSLFKDIRFAIRMLYKTPSLSLIAVLTVALGVGATTHTFSVVYGSVIKGLPFEGSERLMSVSWTRPSHGITQSSVPSHDWMDWREQQTVFEDLAGYYPGTVNVADDEGRPERFDGAFVSANAFAQTGVVPILGRTFLEGEDEPGAAPTIVIGYDVWQNRYGGDPDVIGKVIQANARPHTIIGVMPARFHFPFSATVWVPIALDPLQYERGEGMWLEVFGRLEQGVTPDEAMVQMTAIAQRLATDYPETNEGSGVVITPFTERYMPTEIVAVLYAMLVAVFGVLFIACANVANLLLARAAVRSKEVAIRSALGASRFRVIRQLLAEATVIAVVGGAIGLVIASVGINFFNNALVDIEKPYWIDIQLHPPVLLFALAITLVASLVSGTVPALKASGADINEILKDESKGSSSFRMSRFSTGLVMGEIALSCALLVAAGLMVKSVVNIKTLDMGFDAENVFTARVGLFETDYPDSDSRLQFYERLLERLRALPGTRSAALTTNLPATGSGRSRFAVEGESYPTDQDYPLTYGAYITPGFFETFGVSLSQGRDFGTQDSEDNVPVTIVNQSFARRFFPNESPIGKRIRQGTSDSEEPWLTVVGVVPDLHIGGGVGGIGDDARQPEQIYTPHAQSPEIRFISLAVKTAGPPMGLAPEVRDVVIGLDPNLPIYWVDSMEGAIETNTWAFGLFGSLFTIFGVIALFMSAVGLYGVMAFSVSRRTQEMGIRIALGAYGKDIIHLVLKKGLVQLGIGMTIGLGLGVALSRPLQLVLFDVNVNDPAVYGAIIATLTLAGLLACLLPARKATRVDVVNALKPE